MIDLRETLTGAVVMAPMTKGSNLPYRRLCVELGARVTISDAKVGTAQHTAQVTAPRQPTGGAATVAVSSLARATALRAPQPIDTADEAALRNLDFAVAEPAPRFTEDELIRRLRDHLGIASSRNGQT